ncbi:MAG: sodium:solute symporter family protein [Chromatiales bacterium]|nr:MAG: sodium:solute symporter family protein [Chromatiales bacterium]
MSFAWALFIVYLAGTAWLGFRGMRKTSGFSSFALGDRAMNPVIVGITLAASVSSASTFIINPGFVYVDGFGAFFHMSIGVAIGFLAMLTVLSFQFRRIGAESSALTIPDWIGKRYESPGFALYFSVLNLLSFAFVVLLVGGISIVMQSLLGISNVVALTITLVFVTGYVFIGGTYAHVLTNMLQGSLMVGVTILVLGSCILLAMQQPGSIADALRQVDPSLVAAVNTDGQLFNSVFSIYVAGFIVGAIVVCQPHILTKALYVKDDRSVKQYLLVFTVIFLLFQMLGAVGFFTHLAVPPEALVDSATGQFRQDLVMTQYLAMMFPPWVFTIVGIVLLAAAMSTLDGLLVSMSTITANDLVLNLAERKEHHSEEEQMAFALKVSHVVLVVIAIAAFLINLQPPKLLGIFGQTGVYGLTAAAAPPLLLGVLFRRVPIALVWSGSAAALVIHFVLFFKGADMFPTSSFTFANPGVTVSLATLAVMPVLLVAGFLLNRR